MVYTLGHMSLHACWGFFFVGRSFQTLKAPRQKSDLLTLDWFCPSDVTYAKCKACVIKWKLWEPVLAFGSFFLPLSHVFCLECAWGGEVNPWWFVGVDCFWPAVLAFFTQRRAEKDCFVFSRVLKSKVCVSSVFSDFLNKFDHGKHAEKKACWNAFVRVIDLSYPEQKINTSGTTRSQVVLACCSTYTWGASRFAHRAAGTGCGRMVYWESKLASSVSWHRCNKCMHYPAWRQWV